MRRRFTARARVLQAAWTSFDEPGAASPPPPSRRALALLHGDSVTTVMPGGAVHETPLVQPAAAAWPLPGCLLLEVAVFFCCGILCWGLCVYVGGRGG